MFSFVLVSFSLTNDLLSHICSVLGGGALIDSSLKSGQNSLTPSHRS
jgi:hypothetical protein